MNTSHATHPDTSAFATKQSRILGATWLIGAVPVAVPAWMLLVVSDLPGDRVPGTVLSLMTLGGLAVGGWVLNRPGASSSRTASLAMSAAWLVGAVAVYPTQEFTADALWAAGVPAIVALVTGGLALWRGPRRRTARSST